ncbi:DUF418 domain-containing protein [Actinoplanes derwentensis]|uniref:DUF418 domain-containing protein n=1 Tax=Actinoplanes derwentensis TaxID=113562 RepID=A0A1H1WY40_9ACTN|nr:DUF418 domain-containing protein [Actinoplanes derwentensis]GID85783.1 hypothetical protein Ade03nite_47070 [Actinoplanes derwentensis]SDT02004.1 uncharacterized protein SAMN04489716_2274 [Actinoplanes derwentensis]
MTTTHRIPVLDVLRGTAILGTLGTNIWIFTDPRGPSGSLITDTAGVTETLLRTLSNGKFLALLTLLFGIGLELQYRSARRRGHRWPGWYLWRAVLLLAEGALHYLLIFEWDVLMAYALVSILVAGIVGRSDRAVRTCMAAAALLHLTLIGLLTLAGVDGGDTTGRYPSGYAEQVTGRIHDFWIYRSESILIIPLTVLLFLAGSRLLRAGVLTTDPAGTRLRRHLTITGLGVGVPLNLLTAFGGPRWFFVDRYVCAPLVALGLLAALTSLLMRTSGSPRLAAVGRTALSCYVLQNLICAILCYGWGLGLAGRFADLRPWWPPLAWAAVSALLITAAGWWLRRFDRGPLETAWHWAWRLPQRTPTPANP